ncbi:MAG TPA: cyclic dehypoxanthinyl futalosine synthase [candidate division Zixibacteria bacterium]|nr:cyclic dehypoxanthinyl futalosine synthase [candidate division Zixibacteria bacterium]
MSRLTDIQRSVAAGGRISAADALYLLSEAPLQALGSMASDCRYRHNPEKVVTYIVDRNINYTNICNVFCKFCAFYRTEKHSDGYTLTFAEISEKIEEARALGATRILLQGGHNEKLDIEFYERMFRHIKTNHVIRNHALGPPEVCHIAKVSNLTIEETLDRLIAAGLDSMPGGGAEILTEATRQRISPRKNSPDEWMEVMRQLHRRKVPTTSTMMLGVGESLAERVEHLQRIRDLQDETGGFTSFIPWTFQPGNTALEKKIEETDSFDYLRTLAVARIYLDNVRHVQLSYVTQGPQIGQLSLFYGADDFGSTMIEENVVSAAGTDFIVGEEELRRLISEAGFEPRLRDDSYEAFPPLDTVRTVEPLAEVIEEPAA